MAMKEVHNILVRMPRALHADLVDLAKQDGRSVNAEVRFLIEREAMTRKAMRSAA